MEEYPGHPGLVQVKTCDTEMSGGAGVVTSVNNNNTKFSRCEGCGELIMDRWLWIINMIVIAKQM